MTALSITDHGTLSGHRDFLVAAKNTNVKPILGLEAYFTPDRLDKRSRKDRGVEDQIYNHLIVLAKNEPGLQNLSKLSEIGWNEGFFTKPRIDFEVLEKYSSDLVIVSGCMNSIIAKAIQNGNHEMARKHTEWFKEVFKDNMINYKEIYPIVTNNGTSLFIQMIMYKLKIGGICAIVLPDGELMSSNNTSNINMRKFILDNAKIIKIINVEGGVFQNTNIKTKVLIFQKGKYDNYNQEIEFLDVINEGKEIKLITKQKLNKTYQFNIKKQEEIINYNKDIEIKTLGEVCEFQNGYSFKSSDYEKQNDTNIGILQIKSIQNGYIYDNKITEYIKENKKYISFEIQKGDILIGLTGSFKIGLYNLDKKSYLNQRVGKITAKTCIIQKYIYYWYLCCDIEGEILKIAKGAAQANISTNDISNIKIPFPSLEQQKEIVEYLDIIDKNTKSSNNKIEEIKKLNENYLKLNLKYNKKIELIEFGQIFDLIKGKIQSSKVEENDNGKYAIISIAEKNKLTNNIDEKYLIDGENIFIATTSSGTSSGPYETKIKYYNGLCSYTCLLAKLELKQKYKNIVYIKYIYYYLLNNKEYIEKTCEKGCANKSLDVENFNLMKIPIPSLEKQKEIVEYLDFNNNLINNFNKEIENNKKQGETFFNMFLSN